MSGGFFCYEEQRKEDGQRTPWLVSILDTFQARSNSFSMSEGMLWSQTWRMWTYLVFRKPPSRYDLVCAATDEARTCIWQDVQSLNWQRQDAWRDHKWSGHCRENWCPQGLSVQNLRNVLSANHCTLDGCDAMATLLFSCKLQRSSLAFCQIPCEKPHPDKPLSMEACRGQRGPVPPKCRTRNSKTGWPRRKQRDSRTLSGWS